MAGFSRAWCALILWMGFVSVGTWAAETGREGSTDPKLERETFQLINQYRVAEKLPRLRWNNDAAKAARMHSRDMALGAVDFGHEGFGERVKLLRSEIPGMMGMGENVLMTSDPAQPGQQAVTNWLKSPPHRHNIRGDFEASGVGIWIGSEGTIYFTQIFVKIARTSDPDDAGM